MSSLRLMLVVLYKELIDNFRDRRALATALLMPLLGPIMVPLLLTFVADVQEKARAPVVPIEHRERAPELVAYLERSGIKLEPAPADPEQAVRDADVDLVLQIPEEYGPALRAGQPAPVVLIADPSRTAAGATIRRVEQVLQQYGAHLRMLRVVARGIDPLLLHPIAVQVHDVAPPEARGAMLLGILPLFLLMACFVGGTYVAIDVTAGERERGSLEPLLLNPVTPAAFVIAKALATVVAGVIGVALALAGFAVAIAAARPEEIGIELHLPPATIVLVFGLLLPVAILGGVLQVFVGILSKNFKTAQAAISFIMLVPTLPGAAMTMFPPQASLWLSAVPSAAQQALVMRLLRGETLAASHVAVSVVTTLLVAGLLLFASVRLFGPRLLVGR